MRGDRTPFRNECGRKASHLEPEKILDLTREDDDRDSTRESNDHRMWYELDRCAEAGDAEHDEYDPRHQRGDDEPVDTEALDDTVDDDDERAGRSSDLNSGSAKRRDEKAGNNRGVKPAIRCDTAGDGKRNGERKSNDTNYDAGYDIGIKLRTIVGLEGGY